MNDKNQLYIPEWLLLDKEVRMTLAEMFELKRDIATEVAANQVVCDGYSNEMLSKMNFEAIRDKGIDGEDFLGAFANLLKSLESKKEEETAVETNETKPEEPKTEEAK
jgi:hypothetical protein